MNQSDRIRLLEEQGRVIEEKIKRLTQMMDDITFELENLKSGKIKKPEKTKRKIEIESESNGTNDKIDDKSKKIKTGTESENNKTNEKIDDKSKKIKTGTENYDNSAGKTNTEQLLVKLDMAGGSFENVCLGSGWYQPSDGFRWTGKDGKNPVIYFVVEPNKSYKLVAKLFVPEPLAGKPIKIIINEKETEEMKTERQRKIVKSIVIPAAIVPTSRLRIEFVSDIWNPKEIDPTLEDKKLSLAFDYIELYGLKS